MRSGDYPPNWAERKERERQEQEREFQRIRAEYQQQLQIIQELRTQNQQLIETNQQQTKQLDGQIKQLIDKNQDQTKIIEEVLEQKEMLVQIFSNQFNQLSEDNKKLSVLLNALANPLDELLLNFSKEGDINKIKATLILGADIETHDREGLTPSTMRRPCLGAIGPAMLAPLPPKYIALSISARSAMKC